MLPTACCPAIRLPSLAGQVPRFTRLRAGQYCGPHTVRIPSNDALRMELLTIS
jgi:hypothetical protein